MVLEWLLFRRGARVLEAGHASTLTVSNLEVFSSDYGSSTLSQQMEESISTSSKTPLAIVKSFFQLFGRSFVWGGPLVMLCYLSDLASSILLYYIIKDLNGTRSYGIHYCVAIFILCMTSSVAANNYYHVVYTVGVKARVSISCLIFRKAQKLSPQSQKLISVGKILNLMTNDAERLEYAVHMFHDCWAATIQIVLVCICLYRHMGYSAMVGVAIFLLLIPILGGASIARAKCSRDASQAADQRIGALQDMLEGMRVVKFYGWEDCFEDRISKLRNDELRHIRRAKSWGVLSEASSVFCCVCACTASFLIYRIHNELTIQIAGPAISYFALLSWPLQCIPMSIGVFADAVISLHRLCGLLQAEEVDNSSLEVTNDQSIKILDASFAWSASKMPTLKHISLDIKPGTLIAVIGTAGSGKSSLLASILGNLHCVNGKIVISNHLAFCPQQAWIQHATIRENILFGSAYQADRYNSIIKACSLISDFESLPGGDQFKADEKGANLSGGQKQRISLARAAYSQAPVMLLDDPLSAVDTVVGKHIFKHCIQRCMSQSTRILVTHQIQLLKSVDYIICMDDGFIADQGTYSELKSRNFDFGIVEADEMEEEEVEDDRMEYTELIEMDDQEEHMSGSIASSVFRTYLKYAGGLTFVSSVIIGCVVQHTARYKADIWISDYQAMKDEFHLFTAFYIGLGLLQTVAASITNLIIAYCTTIASKTIHKQAFKSVQNATMQFFNSNPTGRIVSRFSRDQDILDSLIKETIESLIFTSAACLTAFVSLMRIHQVFAITLLVLLIYFYYMQGYYRQSARELRRMEGRARAPFLAVSNEALIGINTIRSYKADERFLQSQTDYADVLTRIALAQVYIQQWLFIRLELANNLIVLIATAACYYFQTSAEECAVPIGYALSISGYMDWLIRRIGDLEVNMIAAERMSYYSNNLPQEAICKIDSTPKNWPQDGSIEFSSYSTRYGIKQPLVLKGLSMSIKHGERIGIVGRTGAGKSSIMLSLFRMMEADSGSIFINNVDISTIPLHTLRSRLSIIPQDPVIFSGTIRWNLDPFQEHNDVEIWSVLERSHLKSVVKGLDQGLDTEICSGGSALSLGHCQLLCLARAMLKQSKILLLDEATANIDHKTDALVQKSLKTDFPDCTVITIAHRLSTILDYDRIIVLEKGSIVECDAPQILLSKKTSMFSKLYNAQS